MGALELTHPLSKKSAEAFSEEELGQVYVIPMREDDIGQGQGPPQFPICWMSNKHRLLIGQQR